MAPISAISFSRITSGVTDIFPEIKYKRFGDDDGFINTEKSEFNIQWITLLSSNDLITTGML